MTNASPLALDDDAHHTLLKAKAAEQKLSDHLIAILACRNVKESVFAEDDAVEVNSIDTEPNVVIARYAGATIRFQLFTGITERDEVIGRVTCSHEYDFHGQVRREYLGDFTVGADGRTNFAHDHAGRPRYIQHTSDLIVAHFLRKALQRNLTFDGQSKPGL